MTFPGVDDRLYSGVFALEENQDFQGFENEPVVAVWDQKAITQCAGTMIQCEE